MVLDRSRVDIDLQSFRANLQELKGLLKTDQSFLQIVKADAYGHGAYEIARIAIQEGAQYLGVANVEEGKLLRLQGIEAPILILSPSLPGEIPEIIKYKLSISVSDREFARDLDHQARVQNVKVFVHLKIDTGMYRSGIDISGAKKLWSYIQSLEHIILEGIYSHFAASESDLEYSRIQAEEFIRFLESISPLPRFVHMANSSALLHNNLPEANLVRLGILSYGIYTSDEQKDILKLNPVMTFKSAISQIKRIAQGRSLGYNLTWKAARDTIYAIVPVGYADGYDYLLGNSAQVMIEGMNCPVIGKVSMDMITIDVTDVPEAVIGSSVTLMGSGKPEQRAEHLCRLYHGSPYELLCQVGRRAKRYYYKGSELVTSSPLARRDFVSTDFDDSKLNLIIESALSQRLQSDEIGELIYREILRNFFYNKDRDVHYRRDFKHSIQFLEPKPDSLYYRTLTKLTFSKVLDNEYFSVACTNSDTLLKRYFLRKDVEYRWLMDTKAELNDDVFQVSSVRVNGIELDTEVYCIDGCLEIRCSHPVLKDLVGTEVDYSIETITLYPVSSHQLSIFITELTRGVEVEFIYPESFTKVEVVNIFSGQSKFPIIVNEPNRIKIQTEPHQWVFPISGVVFSY